MTDPSLCQALVKIDSKVSRALQNGKGVKLSSADLELLASIGVIGVLAEAKARALEAEARNRQTRARPTTDNPRAPIAQAIAAEDPEADEGASLGALALDASSGRLRAQRIFGSASVLLPTAT